MKNHKLRGALITVVGVLALALLMFLPRFFLGGVAVGFGLLLLITIGVLDFFGSFKITREAPAAGSGGAVSLDDAPGWLKLLAGFNIPILYVGLGLFAAGACRVSVIDTMGAAYPWSGPLFFGLGVAAVIVARVRRRPFDGNLHEGLLVLSLATATIMATLGSHGLWDCWETHYGEVARRQLEQDDWISLFWENKWFYSKPILIFWLMNLGMALFGVRVDPDAISSHSEWGVRFFVGLLAIAVIWGFYTLIARRISRRGGLFVALVLATLPLFSFMARQAITDMPFVGFMSLAVVLFLLGVTAGKDDLVGSRSIPLWGGRRLELSGFHGLVLGYIVAGVPQFIYLATRSASYTFGTLGRGDLRTVSSQEQLTEVGLSDVVGSLFGYELGGVLDISLDWFLLGLAFAAPFGVILFTMKDERRVSRLAFHGMYLCLGLSVMAKGLAGFVMPILGLVGFWAVIVPWSSLRRPLEFVRWHLDKAVRLDLLRGIPMFLLVAAPWYVAMFVRHSTAFINRFFIHDHIKRISVGVHGETGTFEYFAQQFGYAAFPWVALAPFALLAWPRLVGARPETREQRSEWLIRLFATTWGVCSFALLAMMITKFHHYIFPILPPMAILIGLYFDDIWTGRVKRIGPVVLVGMVLVAVVARDLVAQPEKAKGVFDGYAQLVGLFIYKYVRPYPEGEAWDFSKPLLVFSLIFVALLAAWIWERRRKAVLALTIVAVLAFSHWTMQHYMVQLAPHWTQKHLIGEYYDLRDSPRERLIAFQMNWKGENFYTGNRVVVYVSTKNKKFEDWIDKHRGERHFFITEQSRFNRMSRRAKPASGPMEPLSDTCNKYKIGVAEEL